MPINPKHFKKLATEEGGKIVFLVIDGLGGLPDASGDTPLEAADTPHLDQLAKDGISGLHEPVGPGITPGSGPGHLGARFPATDLMTLAMAHARRLQKFGA